jgi:hypothetical protein
MVQLFAAILEGRVPNQVDTPPDDNGQLNDFVALSRKQWESLVSAHNLTSPLRMPNGSYECAFSILGSFEQPTLGELRQIISQRVTHHSGWPSFIDLNRRPYSPSPVDGAVQAWVGPDSDGSTDSPDHHDFWRISPEGFMYLKRGYSEDRVLEQYQPGAVFDITVSTWRIADAIFQAYNIAKGFGLENFKLLCKFDFFGIKGRQLVALRGSNRLISTKRICNQERYEKTITIDAQGLPELLPEVVDGVLRPLYELFDFFSLPKDLTRQEIAKFIR